LEVGTNEQPGCEIAAGLLCFWRWDRLKVIVRLVAISTPGCDMMRGWPNLADAGAWMLVSRLALDKYISNATAEATRPVFSPLIRYCESDLPGAHALGNVWWHVNPPVMVPARPHGFIGYNAPLSPPSLPFDEMLRRSRQPPKGMRFQVDPPAE
jgi:hypothetical protein